MKKMSALAAVIVAALALAGCSGSSEVPETSVPKQGNVVGTVCGNAIVQGVAYVTTAESQQVLGSPQALRDLLVGDKVEFDTTAEGGIVYAAAENSETLPGCKTPTVSPSSSQLDQPTLVTLCSITYVDDQTVVFTTAELGSYYVSNLYFRPGEQVRLTPDGDRINVEFVSDNLATADC